MTAILEAFKKFDEDGSGAISRDELAQMLKRIDEDIWDDEKIDNLLNEADANNDGKLSYEEFVKWLFTDDEEGEFGSSGQKLYEATGTGTDIEAAKRTMSAIRKEADADGDGKVDEDEIVALVRNHTGILDIPADL